MEDKARKYRLKETTTPERLACSVGYKGTVVEYGDMVILADYHYNGKDDNGWFAAIYTYTTKDRTIEGEVRFEEVSDELFSDNGHALAWAFGKAR